MENEEQRLVFGQVGYDVVDSLFELCSRNFLARPKVVMLSRSTSVRDVKVELLSYHTYLTEIGDIGVEVLPVFFDGQVSFIVDLLAIAPLD